MDWSSDKITASTQEVLFKNTIKKFGEVRQDELQARG